MPSKYQIISELAAQTAKDISSGAGRYMEFLTTAANNYKYSFKEQLLIHAQKPDATACAEIGMWNKLGRWVNKGTKGIALLVDTDSRYKLRYVFDISDTNSQYGYEVTLWHFQEQFQDRVLEALENSFGELEEHHGFATDLMEISDSVVEDNLADYLEILKSVKEGSLLEELDELNLKAWLKTTVQSSVAYMILTRCGLHTGDFFLSEDFAHVYDFNTPDTIAVLGVASSDIAEMALREIEATVRAAEREAKKDNRTFANTASIGDTVGRNSERSDDHGTDISTGGRLSSAQRDGAGEPEDRQIRDAAERLPEESPRPDLHGDALEWEAENPFGGDRPAGDRDDGAPDHGDGESRGREREPESVEPDAVGRPDERHPGESRGDGSDRPDLRIEEGAAKEAETPDAASLLQPSGYDFNVRTDIPYYHYDAEKQELLRISDALKDHKTTIAAFFADHDDRKERGNFIKSFFNNTYVEKILSNGQRAGYRAYDDVLTLWRGAYLSREMEVFMRWESVASTIYGMILMDKWLEPDERPLPTEGEQMSMIAEEQAEKKNSFVFPQAAIDYVITGGSGVSQGKFRIYEQFLKGESAENNVKFLKNEYGIGGHSDAIPGTGIWEDHDGKGITLKDGDQSVTLKWPAVERRIRELVRLDRYLSIDEKDSYPNYLHGHEVRAERVRIAKAFEAVTEGFSKYAEDMGKEILLPARWYLVSCGTAFQQGEKKMYAAHSEGDFILPMMREALQIVIRAGDNPYLEQAKEILEELSGPLAMGLEPTEEELNPPPKPKKEYRIEPGDTVWLGKEYIVSLIGEEMVFLSDALFPLVQEDFTREEFERQLANNPRNDKYLQDVETQEAEKKQATPSVKETPGSELWQEYQRVKSENNGAVVFYQVGDFYEVLGDDARIVAEALDIGLTTRNVGLSERVPMCGIPTNTKDTPYIMLNDRGYNVVLVDDQGETYPLVSNHKEMPIQSHPIGRVDYLANNGYAAYSIEHTEEDHFVREILDDNNHGVPMSIVVYRQKDGSTIATDFVNRLDPPPQGFEIVDYDKTLPKTPLDRAKELIDEFCRDEYGSKADYSDLSQVGLAYTTITDDEIPVQINADLINCRIDRYVNEVLIERIEYDSLDDLIRSELENLDFSDLISFTDKQIEEAVNEYVPPKDKRYSVVEVERLGNTSYEVWDNWDDHSYLDIDGIVEEFTSRWQAEEYCRRLNHGEDEYQTGDIIQIGEDNDVPEYRVLKTKKIAYDENGLPTTMYGFDAFWDRELQHLKFTNTARLPEGKPIFVIGRTDAQPSLERDSGGTGRELPSGGLTADDMDRPESQTLRGADAREEEFEHVELFGQPMLLTESRVRRETVPDGWFCYDLRGSDYDPAEPILVEYRVVVNHAGTILSPVDLKLDRFENQRRMIGDELNYLGEIMTLGQFCEEHGYSFTEKAEQKPEIELAPPPVSKLKEKISPTMLYPEIPLEQRSDYKITDDQIGVGTPSERYANNVAAIRLLKRLEDENRLATPEEQETLSRYVGWGGLADCFDERNSHYLELKELLTENEYAAARESSLTAFYTPPVVIRSMYQALENMGFQRGNILEPSCGVGNFLGMKPDNLSDSRIYGIELDSISGRIAQQLYQTSSIAVQGFEKTELPDSFFDVAIGNVPFGDFKVSDKRYDKHNFLIHDYFFARTLDKVRPGGIIAFVTSKGTLDKTNPGVRKYIAQRADLLGAIRLPNDTFKSAAGTEVTSDILFLQKRETLTTEEPDWVHLGTDENGITMNRYFVDNPDMVLGEMREVSGPYGPETACMPYEDQELGELLSEAIQNITGSIREYETKDIAEEEEDKSIPADPSVRNFSYTLVDGKVYYRENSRMVPVDVSVTGENRIKGLIGIRDCVRQLIEYQTEDYPDSMVEAEQRKLNQLYDSFSVKYGLINSRANKSVFNTDNSFFLLSSLEVLDDEGNFVRKADMFSKRTIKQRVEITHVDTAAEALAISLAEKAKVDMPYMMELTGKDEPEIYDDLKGVIFLNPMHGYGNDTEEKYLTADEYLSGNVREKLMWARRSAELSEEDFGVNVKALEQVQPVDLTAPEISVRIGATWIPPEDYARFMFELFDTPWWSSRNIKIHYSTFTGEWNIEGKTYDRSNVKANKTYGTDRINGYKIMEQTLNLKDVRIFDYVEDENGKKTPVLNKKETAIAQAKQEQIKQAFLEWIWKDQERRERLCKLYNEKFNSVRPREYDGSHLALAGINPEITLRQHQLNAVARGLYGGNELLGHVVGAGKTFTMVAIAQESKRLGLCQKSLIVVPNHLTEQWASEYLQLYPSANILVATAKDFETKNRKRFCGRIATGDYDAVIIGHSQLEKIPLSFGRQCYYLEQQRQEIMDGIIELKANRGDRFSVKQLEKEKKRIEQKLEKLNDQSRKDDIVTFEELGIDRLFIDEAHYYKNLAAFTKMRNVGGISQTEAQKSSDLYMKIRYLDELTGGRGVCFATGTPISNTMVEMYTMQKYLQYDTLKRNDLIHFDSWASTFGETVTAIELAPEGTGYRAKTRFAKFYNLPELMSMFKECADIQTADMLNLPVPKANYHTVALKPSEYQKQMVEELAKRAERVRNGMVNSSEDNMLVITNDGRKLALDQRLMNPMLPESENGKVAACAKNVFEIWQRTKDQRSTQMVFCDLSTPHGDGQFNVYDALRDKLLSMGIPAEEIAYIHSAGTEVKKKELFGKVRSGQIRVLIGSTQKMGAGTNVQKKLIAEHHLDCPWRPADLQQREGRIIRQGNENPEVDIYTYVTENTFDAYLYQLVESKQKFIGQIMTSKSPVRSAEDIDETALSYAEIKALCSGNPKIKEKMDLDVAVAKLKLLKANHLSQIYSLESDITHRYPKQITEHTQIIEGLEKDIALRDENTKPNEDGFSPMVVEGKTYTDKKAAGSAILEACKAMTSPDAVPLGQYRGFTMELYFESFTKEYRIILTGSIQHTVSLGMDIYGNIQRMDNVLEGMESRLADQKQKLEHTKEQLETAKEEVKRPFPQEAELKEKQARLDKLNIELNMDKPENEVVDTDREEDESNGKSTKEMEAIDHDR